MVRNGKGIRSSALARHCIHASQMVRTPVQVHSLSIVSMPAKWSEHPCKCVAQHCNHGSQMVRTPVQVHSLSTVSMSNGKNTRSSGVAQHCIHASQMVRTPVQVHSLSTVSMPAKWSEHPFKRTRSALYPCQPNGKNTRSSALAQHCIHAKW